MAKKDNYSIDDILNEYSVDEKKLSITHKSKDNIKVIKNTRSEDTDTSEEDGSLQNSNESKSTIENKTDNLHTGPIILDEPAVSKPVPDPVIPDQTSVRKPIIDTVIPEKLSLTKTKFIDRSPTRIQDKPNKIVLNPQDNIRYVRKTSKENGTSLNPKISKKRKFKEPPKTKSDLKDLEISSKKDENESASVHLFNTISDIRSKINQKSSDILKTKSVSQKDPKINVKSIPDVNFFSIDVEINDDYHNPETRQKRTIRDIFSGTDKKDSSKTADRHIDDYNAPGDASLILDDLYELKGNLSAKFAVQLIALLISIYFSAAPLYNLPMINSLNPSVSPHTYSFVLFLISAIVLFSSFSVVTSGLKNIFMKKADCDSLVSLSLIISTIAAAISTGNTDLIQNGNIYIFTPVAIAGFMINTIGKHLIVNRAINNFDALISDKEKHALIYIDDETKAQQLTKGIINDYPILAASKKTNFAADFLKYTYSSDISDRFCKTAVPAITIFSLLMTVVSTLFYHNTLDTFNPSFVAYAFSLFISAGACFGIPIIVNLPLSSAATDSEENESIILGYQSIDDFYDTNSIIINASQLFPENSIKLSTIKIFSDTKIDDAIIAAASLAHCSGSIFFNMFNKIIDGDLSLLEHVENYSYEDSMGLCGWINNKRILFGNRQLMINHNIEGMPPKSKEKDIIGRGKIAVYLSVSGNLAAMYVIKLKADPTIVRYLHSFTNDNISLIVKSIDSIASVTRISRMFNIPEDMLKIIPAEYHDYCTKITSPVPKISASVICSGTLSSFAKAISNIKSIHQSALTGIILQSTAVIIGIFITLAFLFLGAISDVTPLMLLFYNTVWTFITIIIMKVRPK